MEDEDDENITQGLLNKTASMRNSVYIYQITNSCDDNQCPQKLSVAGNKDKETHMMNENKLEVH